jgi:hypothetical protein
MADCVTLKTIEETAASLEKQGIQTLDDLRMSTWVSIGYPCMRVYRRHSSWPC